MTSPDEIWILCDSRSAIQHLSDWTNVGDKTSVSILKNLKELSQQHDFYFQWIPSHIGLFGNDTADLLAKEGVTENLMSRRTLTFSEIFSKTKSLIQELWKTPPTHPWYNRQAPGGALSIKADRVVQTTISRLASGHIRGLSFNLGQKIYENCTKCNLVQATPDHLLFCAGLEREDIYSSPLLVEIGSLVGRNQITVMRICDRWMQEGTTDRRGQSHPPQCTTSLSERTIRLRLQQSGLSARRPLLGLPLTQNHRRLHRQ
ncbi:putative RNA-directed DNA polymerase from transposon BS [Trichonephila clavipes]|nr:putative RNA-directed DNA polymerase from transposon BS [Trichonephila clavipes]